MLDSPAGDVKPETKRAMDRTDVSPLQNLPTEILLGISGHLDILDRAALALSCKDVAARLVAHHHLDWDGAAEYAARQPRLPFPFDSLLYFFQDVLAQGWVPRTLKYCPTCRKYAPRDDPAYWLERVRMEFAGGSGWLSRIVGKEWLSPDRSQICANRIEEASGLWVLEDSRGISCPRCVLVRV